MLSVAINLIYSITLEIYSGTAQQPASRRITNTDVEMEKNHIIFFAIV
jgi:hypothetical protein